MNPVRTGSPIRESARVLGLYVRGQVFIAAILTVLYSIAFALAHVPLWPLIAIAGGLSNFIPRIGSVVPLLLATLAIVLGGHGLTSFWIMLSAWVLIQAIQAFYLSPRLLRKPLGLRAIPVFLALLAGSLLFGPIGVLLAIPILAVAGVWWRYFRNGSA